VIVGVGRVPVAVGVAGGKPHAGSQARLGLKRTEAQSNGCTSQKSTQLSSALRSAQLGTRLTSHCWQRQQPSCALPAAGSRANTRRASANRNPRPPATARADVIAPPVAMATHSGITDGSATGRKPSATGRW
jgi:hypothetical protein